MHHVQCEVMQNRKQYSTCKTFKMHCGRTCLSNNNNHTCAQHVHSSCLDCDLNICVFMCLLVLPCAVFLTFMLFLVIFCIPAVCVHSRVLREYKILAGTIAEFDSAQVCMCLFKYGVLSKLLCFTISDIALENLIILACVLLFTRLCFSY